MSKVSWYIARRYLRTIQNIDTQTIEGLPSSCIVQAGSYGHVVCHEYLVHHILSFFPKQKGRMVQAKVQPDKQQLQNDKKKYI